MTTRANSAAIDITLLPRHIRDDLMAARSRACTTGDRAEVTRLLDSIRDLFADSI